MNLNVTQIQALLFDLDGTLIDSKEDIAASANAVRVMKGLEPLSTDTIGGFVGDGVDSLVRRLMPPEYEAEIPELVKELIRHYHDHCTDKTALYPDVKETLEALAGRGYKLAVVTNKPERISSRILELLGVAEYFGSVIGGNSCQNKKPHPEPLQEACRRMGVDIKHACMVGDSRVDIEAGMNAGIPSVGILGGIGDEALLRAANPGVLLATFGELDALFSGKS